MTFEPFQSALDKAASSYGIAREFRAIKVCKTFESLIPTLFKVEAQAILTQNSFVDGILNIGVPASIWASELMMKKETILTLLNERLQNDPAKIKVKDLRTKII